MRYTSAWGRHRALLLGATGAVRDERYVRAVERIIRRVPRLAAHRVSQAFWIHVSATQVRRIHSVRIIEPSGRQTRVEHHHTSNRERAMSLLRVRHTRVVQSVAHPPLTAAPPAPGVVVRMESRHAYPQISTTVVRASAAAASPSPSSRRSEMDSLVQEHFVAPLVRRQADAITLPPQELSRVADHVIHELDRRVLSYRERTGQV